MEIYVLTRKEEQGYFRRLEKTLTGNRLWNDCELYITASVDKWNDALEECESLTSVILICDVTVGGAVSALKEARNSLPQAVIIPIADMTILPSEYVNPQILPFSLLWKPLQENGVQEAILNALKTFEKHDVIDKENCFELETKQEKRFIPYIDIQYFEARNKKLYLRMDHQEICFYSTLGKLEALLPAIFARCHKSFIVNKKRIQRIDWAESIIYLGNKIGIPVSRSYRKLFKEEADEI